LLIIRAVDMAMETDNRSSQRSSAATFINGENVDVLLLSLVGGKLFSTMIRIGSSWF